MTAQIPCPASFPAGIPVASLALDKFKQCVTDTLLLPPMKTAVATIMGDKGNADPSLTVAQMVTLVNKDHRDPRWNEIHQPESTAYGGMTHP